MRISNLSRNLFAVAVLVFGFICNSAFATGCIGNATITSDPTNLGNTDVRLALLASFDGAKGTVPLPYQYAIGNASSGKYGIYTIEAQYVQSPSGAVTTTPVFGLSKSGTTKSGLPPANSGCPKTDSGTTNGGVPPLDGTGGGPGGFGPTPPSPTPIVGVGPVVGCGSDPRCINQN